VIDRHREQAHKRLQRGREARRVRPLGPVRKRELSESAKERQSDQKDCPLFDRLPAEVRTMIWHYVLGGQTYHLMQVPKRVGHHRCEVGTSSDPGRSCCLAAMAYWRHEFGTTSYRDYLDRYPGSPLPYSPSVEMFSTPPKCFPNTLALLRTCQRIYRESVNIPYDANTFDIDDPETLLSLRQTIPRQRLRAIKHLRVYVETQYPPYSGMYAPPWYGNFDGLWTLMWHTIAKDMTGLEAVELTIQSGSIFPEWPRKDPPWCAKLRDVRGLKSFQLTVKEGLVAYSEDTDEDMKVLIQSLRECLYEPRSVNYPIKNKEIPLVEVEAPLD
jgi:2EXR family